MSERNISRPWTESEDGLLRQAVAQYGENDNWKNIALSVPGRTNKACRKRWLHSLQPNVKKSAWTPSEDQLLLELYEKHGPKWSTIARQIAGRTDDACSKRYREALDPTLKKDQWSPEEDERLMEVFNRIGGKWGQVGQELQRSGLGCRNRWRLLERKKASRTTQFQSPTQAAFPVNEMPTPPENVPLSILPQGIPTAHWPPYYPPEAYPTFPTDEGPRLECTFREPTPEAVVIPDPYIAPFQFSSSSLSAALSDPPRPYAPLPPITVLNTPELDVQDAFNDSERQPSLSPLSQCNGMPPDMNDVLMSLDEQSQPPMVHQPLLDMGITQLPFDSDRYQVPALSDYNSFYSASPLSFSAELHPFSIDLWKVRNPGPELDFDSPRSAFDGFTNSFDYLDDYSSSTASTPFILPGQLSPASSPNPVSPVELPAPDLPSTGSLLFSPADGAQALRRPKKATSRKHKPSIKVAAATRLSSLLPLSNDPSIKPYACGRPACWPTDATTSSSCFATSGELLDHCKEQHSEAEVEEKPYRCALAGCGKSWKSINGLQYHLQISTAHFSNALFSKFSQQPSTPVHQMASLSTDADSDESDRRYVCPKVDCYKAYRQPSGLRYHMKHGHPVDLPTQLDFVPPALERQMPTKAKKLRAKPFPDGAVTLPMAVPTTS